jgi:signal transduction histidine kinase
VNLDKVKLKQAIINIIWNAVKYTKNDWLIIIKSFVKRKKLYIISKDTWIWIKKSDIPKIFSKFWQIKNSYTRDIWWTWLWLCIVQWIIDNFKWKLMVKSKVWIWSEFIMVLPFK